MVDNLLYGLGLALAPATFIYLVLGVVLGLVVGALPGLTATMTMIVILPITFSLSPLQGIALLMGVFVAGITAGSVTAIAVNIPGTPASAATCLDGYPLTQQGRAGEAISVMFLTSMIGGIIGAVALIFFAPSLAEFALRFGPPEYFLLALIGTSLVVSLSGESLVKGLIGGFIGMLLALVGVDPISAYPRFTFGIQDLQGGISYGAVMIGMFGFTEVLASLERLCLNPQVLQVEHIKGKILSHSLTALRRLPELGVSMTRSALVGIGIGALPGLGSDVAAWLGYDVEKRWAKRPEEFGKGSLHGLTGCEVANNSEAGGALIPALTFGIPGDPQTVIILGALMLHGIRPGPLLFTQHMDIVWGLFASLIVAQFTTLVLGLLSVHPLLWLIGQPSYYMYPGVTIFCVIGAFAYTNSLFDLWVMMLLGVLGYVMRKYGYSAVPVVIAFILTPMIESELRRGLMLYDDSFLGFFTRPLFDLLVVVGLLSFYGASRLFLTLRKETGLVRE